jgi:hypothetical protein
MTNHYDIIGDQTVDGRHLTVVYGPRSNVSGRQHHGN